MTTEQKLKLSEFKALTADRQEDLNKVAAYIQNSEYELILFMVQQNVWTGAIPVQPPGFTPGSGSIELGLFLYWFNNPNDFKDKEIIFYAELFKDLFSLPPSSITFPNYNFFAVNELIYSDGSVLSMEQYANFDQGWFTAFINLLITFVYKLWYTVNGDIPVPAPPVKIQGANPNAVSIALVGDWGAGNTAAQGVMNQITSLPIPPDYIIHLGDVYYGGTPSTADPISSKYLKASLNEEVNNFVKGWKTQYSGKSFTLNSNHEMYSGANGLFMDVLLPNNSIFRSQGKSTAFALKYADWTILALDSAFYGTTLDAFMQGFIGDASSVQYKWVKSLNLNPAKTIVLTHHTGISLDASEVYPLWDQIREVLGGNDPYAWYWGHAHNGIVYKQPLVINNNVQNFSSQTFARCAGHGALPYGVASSIEGVANVLWQASSPMPAPSKQVYNGFVVLTLTLANGTVRMIDEDFYDPSSIDPKWGLTIFPM
ncbi:MAG: metallophosphoesterase [Sphingobacteriales bacterium]|nr:metallophosphoesterase [Sphingobacteriales bacterium]